MYLIKWYRKDNPSQIFSGNYPTTNNIANAWIKELNNKYPSLHHFAYQVNEDYKRNEY